MRVATDPAVSSIECGCYQQVHSLLPTGGDSSAGARDSPDLYDEVYDEVGRRLSVQVGAPWGIDRIDTDGGAIDGIYNDGDLTGTGVRVYVVDTGVQGSHQDFAGRVVSGHTARVHSQCASCQAVKGVLPADGSGCHWHGTHRDGCDDARAMVVRRDRDPRRDRPDVGGRQDLDLRRLRSGGAALQ